MNRLVGRIRSMAGGSHASHAARRDEVLAQTSDAILILDADGHVDYANAAAGILFAGSVTDGLPYEIATLASRAVREQAVLVEDVTLRKATGQPTRARAVPLGDGSVALLLSDISESRRLDRVRRDFVANVSHELKTPVAAIRALAETASTALGSDDQDAAVRFVERLESEATRLAELVTDLLDLSRVEAGGELAPVDVDIDLLLAEAADAARPVAEAKGIEVFVQPLQRSVRADRAQLSMAVKNLVENAVRYSERGTVGVQAEETPTEVAILVSDQGIGIPPDEIPRIFERFYRVDKARSRATGGTGLGLAIVRHVAENHGGRVEVESRLGVGSTFRLFLPNDGVNGPSA
jgi:two-component system sensor histidine kinase SenX3